MSEPTSTVPPRELTLEERRLLDAYRGMTPWARGQLGKMAQDYALAWPVKKAFPRLRLVSTSASD